MNIDEIVGNVVKPISYIVCEHRTSQDPVVNNYGRRFLDLCKYIDICIVNGRSGSDKGIGKTTCDGKRVVDYIACTPNLFSSIHDFDILPFVAWYRINIVGLK